MGFGVVVVGSGVDGLGVAGLGVDGLGVDGLGVAGLGVGPGITETHKLPGNLSSQHSSLLQ